MNRERAPNLAAGAGDAAAAAAVGGRLVSARPLSLSPSDRLALLAFGAVVGGAAAWLAWRLIDRGEVMIGIGVSGLAAVGALALWSAIRGR